MNKFKKASENTRTPFSAKDVDRDKFIFTPPSASKSRTLNGMPTNKSSLSYCLDLFGTIGSSRGKDIESLIINSLAEDMQIATRILLWSRDVRQGAGERQHFRTFIKRIDQYLPKLRNKVLAMVPELGRWDDLLSVNTDEGKKVAYSLIALALKEGDGLCAKWMPRKGQTAYELRKFMGLSPKQYRKLLVRLTKVVETQMCARDWNEINFSHVPSLAMSRYRKAFHKRCGTPYETYLAALEKGEAKINAGAVYPYDVLKEVLSGMSYYSMSGANSFDKRQIVAQWDALPNFLGEDAILPMVDTSGSMSMYKIKGSNMACQDVALSLGLYIADKNKGAFKDLVLTFSRRADFHTLKGVDIVEKLGNLSDANWDQNTNLELAFTNILKVAIQNEVPASEMPKYLVILSDMEFDSAAPGYSDTALSMIRRHYANAGYKMPKIVFWNLNARAENIPVRANTENCALVSGFSPAIMNSILKAKNFTPYDVMMETVMKDRYSF